MTTRRDDAPIHRDLLANAIRHASALLERDLRAEAADLARTDRPAHDPQRMFLALILASDGDGPSVYSILSEQIAREIDRGFCLCCLTKAVARLAGLLLNQIANGMPAEAALRLTGPVAEVIVRSLLEAHGLSATVGDLQQMTPSTPTTGPGRTH